MKNTLSGRSVDKKAYGDNIASWPRWILTLIIGVLGGAFLGTIIFTIILQLPVFQKGGFLECEASLIQVAGSFGGIYFGLWLCLRLICKTSMRTFLFGKDRKPEVKTALVAGVLFFIGMVISELHAFRNIHLSDAPASIILINLVLVLLFLWLQTTAEEIMFRGIFLRAPYGNSVPTLPKGLGFAVFSSILFMALHTANPEVLQLSGTDVIAGAASYFFAGLGLYIANLLIGGMECGLLLHYLNNFYCFVIISEKVTAVATPTIFFKEGETSGMWALISVLIQYALPLIYLAVVYKRKKKEVHDINAE